MRRKTLKKIANSLILFIVTLSIVTMACICFTDKANAEEIVVNDVQLTGETTENAGKPTMQWMYTVPYVKVKVIDYPYLIGIHAANNLQTSEKVVTAYFSNYESIDAENSVFYIASYDENDRLLWTYKSNLSDLETFVSESSGMLEIDGRRVFANCVTQIAVRFSDRELGKTTKVFVWENMKPIV